MHICIKMLKFHFLFRVYTPFHEDGDISQARKAGEAIANAFIVIGVVLVLTIVLVLLYKFRCYCVSIALCPPDCMYFYSKPVQRAFLETLGLQKCDV